MFASQEKYTEAAILETGSVGEGVLKLALSKPRLKFTEIAKQLSAPKALRCNLGSSLLVSFQPFIISGLLQTDNTVKTQRVSGLSNTLTQAQTHYTHTQHRRTQAYMIRTNSQISH